MAIKIIKNTMKEPIEMECSNCKSVFSFNYEDIEVFESSSIFMTKIRERFVACPVCKSRNYLEKVQRLKGTEIRQSFVDEGETK